MFASLSQPENTFAPIDVSVAGNMTDVKRAQLLKLEFCNCVAFEPLKSTDVNHVFANAYAPIVPDIREKSNDVIYVL